jgi:hypothetical protein
VLAVLDLECGRSSRAEFGGQWAGEVVEVDPGAVDEVLDAGVGQDPDQLRMPWAEPSDGDDEFAVGACA